MGFYDDKSKNSEHDTGKNFVILYLFNICTGNIFIQFTE